MSLEAKEEIQECRPSSPLTGFPNGQCSLKALAGWAHMHRIKVYAAAQLPGRPGSAWELQRKLGPN